MKQYIAPETYIVESETPSNILAASVQTQPLDNITGVDLTNTDEFFDDPDFVQ